MSAAVSVIDDAIARFLREPVTYVVAARDADNVPAICYAAGTRPVRARGRVTLFVPLSKGARLLDDVRDTGALALCVCRPTSLRTLQLKGADAVIGGLDDGDEVEVARYQSLILDELQRVGDGADWIQTSFHADLDDLVTVTFTPTACFVQTPGPDAGRAGATP